MKYTLYYITHKKILGGAKVCSILLMMLLLEGGQIVSAQQRIARENDKATKQDVSQTGVNGNTVFQHLPGVPIEKKYSFIHYDTNHLFIGGDTSVLNRFFKKWVTVATTGQGNVNIMQLGSSHVQGGTFPDRVRCNIMKNNRERVGDRGMIFPYSAARNCNNPPDYAVHCAQSVDLCRNVYKNPSKQLGLCGIAVTAHDTNTHIDIALREEGIRYATNQIIVLGEQTDTLRDGRKVVPMINYDGRDVPPSIVESSLRRYVFNLSRVVDSFRIVLPCHKGQMFSLTGVYLGNRSNGFSYHSIGVNGASLNDYLRCPYFSKDLSLLHPDLVIFGIGINDAVGPGFDSTAFHDRYLQLVNNIRKVNPNCAFIFITNNDSYRRTGRRSYSCNRNALMVQKIMYSLAEETKGAVWDQFEIMGGLKSMTQWRSAQLGQRDRVHFTRAGYQLLGDLLTNALFEAVNDYADGADRSASCAPSDSTSQRTSQARK